MVFLWRLDRKACPLNTIEKKIKICVLEKL